MVRATVMKDVAAFLADRYEGPVTILRETSTEEMSPPYAVVRVASAENMYPGQAEIWDMTVLVGVFHDAESTTPEVAEEQAAAVFAVLDDDGGLMACFDDHLAFSMWERTASEVSIVESNWQHVAAFHTMVSPRF